MTPLRQRMMQDLQLRGYSDYACGLRLLEGAQLQVPDVDGDRTLLHIHGKRRKDRSVPLPDATLALLRESPHHRDLHASHP